MSRAPRASGPRTRPANRTSQNSAHAHTSGKEARAHIAHTTARPCAPPAAAQQRQHVLRDGLGAGQQLQRQQPYPMVLHHAAQHLVQRTIPNEGFLHGQLMACASRGRGARRHGGGECCVSEEGHVQGGGHRGRTE